MYDQHHPPHLSPGQRDPDQRDWGRPQSTAAAPGHLHGAAVAHRQFAELPPEHWRQLLEPGGVLLDLKGIIPRDLGAMRL